MGNQYAIALSTCLKEMELEDVNISDNRLTRNGSQAIINKLRPTLKYLNISQNKFDTVSAITLGQFVKQKATKYVQKG